MFQRILVPLDGSARAEQAIPVALRLAQRSGGSLVLLRVVTSPLEFAWSVMESGWAIAQDIDADIARAKHYLSAVAQPADLRVIKTETVAVPGEPAKTILFIADSYQADGIVLCSHGETGLKRWMLGSVAQKVARHSPVPVLVVREEAGKPLSLLPIGMRPLRLLVPLDGSPLAETALAPATHFCCVFSPPAGALLHLVCVLPLSPVEQESPGSTIETVTPAQGTAFMGNAASSHDSQRRRKMIEQTRTFAVREADTYLQAVAQRVRTSER